MAKKALSYLKANETQLKFLGGNNAQSYALLFLRVCNIGIGTIQYQHIGILANILAMFSDIGNIWMRCTYIYTNKWSRSCSEQGTYASGEGAPVPFKNETLEVAHSMFQVNTYSWIADQRHAHEKSICQQTRKTTTIPRSPLENSRRETSRSIRTIFV